MTTEQTSNAQTSAKPKVDVTEAVVRLRQALNERLTGQAARGEAPWQQKLDPSKGDRLPYNPFSKTGQAMQGVNSLVLASIAQEKGFKDPRWITKQQMEARSWGPIRGQSPASVEFYADSYQRQVRDARGNPVFNEKGEAVKETVKHETPKVFAVNMYNLSQIRELEYAKEKIPQLTTAKRDPDVPSLLKLVSESGVMVQADGGNHFSKASDGPGVIHIPEGDVKGPVQQVHAQALLRGLAEKAVLLDGPAGARRSDTPQVRYIKQQLRVDLATRIMSERLGIPTDPMKTEAFKEKYAAIIRDNPDEIRYAAHDAHLAVERMTKGNFEPAKNKQLEQQQSQDKEHVQQQREPVQQQQREAKASKAKSKVPALER